MSQHHTPEPGQELRRRGRWCRLAPVASLADSSIPGQRRGRPSLPGVHLRRHGPRVPRCQRLATARRGAAHAIEEESEMFRSFEQRPGLGRSASTGRSPTARGARSPPPGRPAKACTGPRCWIRSTWSTVWSTFVPVGPTRGRSRSGCATDDGCRCGAWPGCRRTARCGGAAYRNRTDDLFITSESLWPTELRRRAPWRTRGTTIRIDQAFSEPSRAARGPGGPAYRLALHAVLGHRPVDAASRPPRRRRRGWTGGSRCGRRRRG